MLRIGVFSRVDSVRDSLSVSLVDCFLSLVKPSQPFLLSPGILSPDFRLSC
jgi:hypothetical protein